MSLEWKRVGVMDNESGDDEEDHIILYCIVYKHVMFSLIVVLILTYAYATPTARLWCLCGVAIRSSLRSLICCINAALESGDFTVLQVATPHKQHSCIRTLSSSSKRKMATVRILAELM